MRYIRWRLAMIEKLGALIFAIGAMAGDSENLLIPLAIMALGILIIRKGAKDDSI